jgi:hypothetical protein
VTTAIFSTLVGLFGGIFAFNQIYFDTDSLMEKVVVNELDEVTTGVVVEEGQLTYDKPQLSMGRPSIEFILTKK